MEDSSYTTSTAAILLIFSPGEGHKHQVGLNDSLERGASGRAKHTLLSTTVSRLIIEPTGLQAALQDPTSLLLSLLRASQHATPTS